jgi:hypothetical protein
MTTEMIETPMASYGEMAQGFSRGFLELQIDWTLCQASARVVMDTTEEGWVLGAQILNNARRHLHGLTIEDRERRAYQVFDVDAQSIAWGF